VQLPPRTTRTPAHSLSLFFATQRSELFWNGSQLSALLKKRTSLINAKSTSETYRCSRLLLGFGPPLFDRPGLYRVFARRAAKSGGAMGGARQTFGRSQCAARRP